MFAQLAFMHTPVQYQEIVELNLLDEENIARHAQIPVYVFPCPSLVAVATAPLLPPTQAKYSLDDIIRTCNYCQHFNNNTSTLCEICHLPLPYPSAPKEIDLELTESSSQVNSDAQHILQRYQELQDAQLCIICEENNKNMVFQCGHETCDTCAIRLVLCPTCRTPIETRIKRYVN